MAAKSNIIENKLGFEKDYDVKFDDDEDDEEFKRN